MFRFLGLLLLLPVACVGRDPAHVLDSQQAIVGGTNDSGDPGVVLVLKEQGLLEKETHFNADFNVKDLQGGNDIAVVITVDPLDMTPLTMNRTPIDQAMVGTPVRFIGYGVTAISTTNDTSGIKRQVTTSLAGFDDLLLQFNDGRHITCEGDSGGPAMMKIDGQNEVIAGITSFGDQGCMMFGADTRVDVFADTFVQPFIDQFDPPPPPPPAVPGPDGFIPGEIGATCTMDSDCKAHTCALTGDSGYCTATCDPTQADSCPANTHCGTIGTDPYCLRAGTSGGNGCSTVPDARGSGALLVLGLALLALLARRTRLI